jgi:hypothetical protein
MRETMTEQWVLHIGIHVIRGISEHDVLLLAQMKHGAKLVVLWLVQTVPGIWRLFRGYDAQCKATRRSRKPFVDGAECGSFSHTPSI